MAVDVEQALKQYESTPANEPMHGKAGETRRNPSTDQKRVRREISRKADLEESMPPETEAGLLQKAAKATTLNEQVELLTKVEQIRTAKIRAADASRELDLANTKINDTLVPGFVHERVTASTDWLTELPSATASLGDAQQKLIAEATMWFGRVSDDVKQHPDEYFEQAKNKARHVASQFGDHADAAALAFTTEAGRLLKHAVRRGAIVIQASDLEDMESGKDSEGVEDDSKAFVANQFGKSSSLAKTAEDMDYHNLDPEAAPGSMVRGAVPDQHQPEPAPVVHETKPVSPVGSPTHDGDKQHGGHPEQRKNRFDRKGPSPFEENIRADTSDLHGYSQSFVDSQLRRASSLSREAYAEDDAATAEQLFGDDPYDDAKPPHRHASAMPETDSTAGPANNHVDTFTDNPVSSTDSNRAPALQELQNFTGYDGASVVPLGDSGANALNDNTSGTQDASANDSISSAGFPVGASLTQKESTMTEHAQCPTCGGHGKVAVRKQAYSGLPQVDQIVNADETPGATPLPEDVAFPITGWNPANVPGKISETEQQIAARPQGQPGAPGARGGPGGSVAASVHQANGRDNSGWMGDDGAKGTDYPGYSAPTGYDGSNNLGQPNPVYQYGGDNGNEPHLPYGHQEAPDITNNPGQPYDPSVPHNNDQGYREVSPGMSTAGSRDPFIGAAQEEILRQQELIRTRASMLSRQAQS